MKKKYFTSAVLLVSCICALAQPVLNKSDFPSAYSADVNISTVQREIFDGIFGSTIGNPGPNQTWDFSVLTLPSTSTVKGSYAIVPISEALNSALFPLANYCIKSNYLANNVDFFGDDVYQMYYISASRIELLGSTSNDGTVTCPNNYIYFQFPYSYNTVLNGTYNCTDALPYNYTSVYDAYGALTTPMGAYYANVIRKKTIVDNSLTSFTWINTNPFSVIMEVDYTNDDSVKVYVYYNGTLGVHDVDMSKAIVVYPNPSSSVLNLALSNNDSIDEVVVTDLAGKIVLRQGQTTNQINIQDLSDGMYLLQVFSENGKYQTKFVKQ
jgi:hypothetical protein